MMNFRYPEYLWGFLLLLIPLLIHLLRFRKQQVLRFPGVYKLISLLKETQSTRNLNYYLLLANRLLLFTALILAFAQPSCRSQSAKGHSQFPSVGVLWDVSPSMFQADANGQIPIENAKKNTLKWLKTIPELATIYWIDQPYQSKVLLTRTEAIERLNTLTKPLGFFPVSRLLADNNLPKQPINWFVISDLDPYSLTDFEQWADSQSQYKFIDFAVERNVNYSIDTAYCSELLEGKFKIKISRDISDENVSFFLDVFQNDRFEGNVPVVFQDKMSSVWVTLDLQQDSLTQAKVKLQLPADAYQPDNELFLHGVNQKKIQVFVESDYPLFDLNRLMATFGDRLEITNDLSRADMLVWVASNTENSKSELYLDFIKSGKECIVIPYQAKADVFKNWLIGGSWERLKSISQGEALDERRFRQEPFESSLERYLDGKNVMPKFENLFRYSHETNRDWSRILMTESDWDFLIRRDLGEGRVWLFLADYKDGMKTLRESSWFVGILGPLLLSTHASPSPICAFWNQEWIRVPQSAHFKLQDPVLLQNAMGQDWGTSLGIHNSDLSFTGITETYMPAGWYSLNQKEGTDSVKVGMNIPRVEMRKHNGSTNVFDNKNISLIQADKWRTESMPNDLYSDSKPLWTYLILGLLLTELVLSVFVLRTNR